MSVVHNTNELEQVVREIVERQPVTDIHTHLFAPVFKDLLLWNVDELLTYHYLVAEVMRWSDIPIEDFWALSKQEKADLIWKHLFVKHSPVSEACRGVLTTLNEFGLDVSSRKLDEYRTYFNAKSTESEIDDVLKLSKVEHVVMTNDPFDDTEREFWLSGAQPDKRFHAALRLDPLLNDYANTKVRLEEWGYQVGQKWNQPSIQEVQRFLNDWIELMNPLYVAVSLPSDFAFPEESDRGRIIRDCILPITRQHNIPFAMMIGVKKRVHPELHDAGDFLGKAAMEPLEHLLAHYPENKFLVTMLSRENQHELVVLARKFRNLMVFGCWWFMNNPEIINEMTRMRMEMLGTSFIPQHSDARVLEQLVYKWQHSRKLVANILIDKYNDIMDAGWQLETAEIERDVADFLHHNFWHFLERKPE